MAATVVVNFKMGGVDALQSSIRSISTSAQRESARQVQASNAETRARVNNASTAEKAAKKAVKAQEKISSDAAAAQLSIDGRVTNEKIKNIDAISKAMTKASRERVRTMQQESRESTRLIQEQARAAARIPAVGKGAGRAALEGAGSGLRRAGGIAMAGASLVTAGIGMPMVLDAIENNRSLSQRNALLQNSSGKNLDFTKIARSVSNTVGVDAGEVLGGFEGLAGKAGAAGISAFGGSEAEIIQNYEKLAKVARGAGVSMADLGDVTATLINRGVESKDLVSTVESLVKQGKDGAVEFKSMATMLDASSGALGRFNMGQTDRISTAGGLTQMARTFGKKSAEEATNAVEDLARDLGGKADIIQALTGGKVIGTKNVGGKTQNILGGGVDVGVAGTNRAQLRNINELLPEIIAGAIKSGNAGKIMGEGGMFTGNSTAIIAPLVQAATLGIKKNSEGRWEVSNDKNESEMFGAAAVKAMQEQFSNATLDAGESMKAFDNVMKSTGGSFEASMVRLKNTLGERVAPHMEKLGSITGQVAEIFIKMADAPGKTIAALVGLSVAASSAQAGIGKIFGNIVDRLFATKIPVANMTAGVVNLRSGVAGSPVPGGGGGVPVGSPGGGPTKPGVNMTTAGAAAVALLGGVAVGVALDDAATAGSGSGKERNTRDVNRSNDLIGRLNSGNATDEERAKASDMIKEMGARANEGTLSRILTGSADAQNKANQGLNDGNVTAANMINSNSGLSMLSGVYNAIVNRDDADNAKATAEALSNALTKSQLTVTLDAASISALSKGRDATTTPINPGPLWRSLPPIAMSCASTPTRSFPMCRSCTPE